MIALREVAVRGALPEGYPFSVGAVQAVATHGLRLMQPVTFLVGENGSGKSTLLEAIAVAAGRATVGEVDARRDPTLAGARALATHLRLTWARRATEGFFLRAEDFFAFARTMDANRSEMEREVARITEDPSISARARGYALMPYVREIGALQARYGASVDGRSHGEAFLALFQQRLGAGGLILLDEPEAPLSPQRQLALLALVMDAADRGAQFVIATHSPILMALPGAEILSLSAAGITRTAWGDLEHVTLTRAFLNDRAAYLRHLSE